MLTAATQSGMGLYFRFETVFPKYLASSCQNHSQHLTFSTYYTIANNSKFPSNILQALKLNDSLPPIPTSLSKVSHLNEFCSNPVLPHWEQILPPEAKRKKKKV